MLAARPWPDADLQAQRSGPSKMEEGPNATGLIVDFTMLLKYADQHIRIETPLIGSDRLRDSDVLGAFAASRKWT